MSVTYQFSEALEVALVARYQKEKEVDPAFFVRIDFELWLAMKLWDMANGKLFKMEILAPEEPHA